MDKLIGLAVFGVGKPSSCAFSVGVGQQSNVSAINQNFPGDYERIVGKRVDQIECSGSNSAPAIVAVKNK